MIDMAGGPLTVKDGALQVEVLAVTHQVINAARYLHVGEATGGQVSLRQSQ